MESFLKLVAADLYKHTEGNLAHTAVVFPNKRADFSLMSICPRVGLTYLVARIRQHQRIVP